MVAKKKTKAKPKAIPKPRKPINLKKKKLELLVAGCKLWDKVTAKAHEGAYKVPDEIDRFHGHFYNDGDYDSLQCRITGDKAELTVGGSEGHKAKINLEEKTLDYYDWRYTNNKVMLDLLKIATQLKCKRDDTGVHCKGLTMSPKKINMAFKALAIPASMDYRRAHCQGAHYEDECNHAEIKFFNYGPLKENP